MVINIFQKDGNYCNKRIVVVIIKNLYMVLFAVAVLGIPADSMQSYGLLLAAVGLLAVEALLAVLLTRKAVT
jgi:hypothetical protein